MNTMMSNMTGNRVEQKGSFELAIAADAVFPIFSAEGERLWIPGWDPKPIYPIDRVVRWQTDAVWTMVRDGELLTWWTIEVDRIKRRASYVNFSASRAIRVNVQVEPVSISACRVNVEYLITATTPEGERHVREAQGIDERMKQWKQMIETALPDGVVPHIEQ